MIVISDTSPITNLVNIGQLELLHKVYGKIVIPASVYSELCESAYQKQVIDSQPWITISHVLDKRLLKKLEIDLDKGEAESIVIAIEMKADFLVIDELKGRKIAESMGIRIVGLLGTLIKAKEQGALLAVKPFLEELHKIGFRIHADLYNHILKITNEL